MTLAQMLQVALVAVVQVTAGDIGPDVAGGTSGSGSGDIR